MILLVGYQNIGNAFKAATDGYALHPSFKTAIWVMMEKPDLASSIKAWDEMMWLCVEEFLNELKHPMQEESEQRFTHACALLESVAK